MSANAARQNASKGPGHPAKTSAFAKKPLLLQKTAAIKMKIRPRAAFSGDDSFEIGESGIACGTVVGMVFSCESA